MMHVRGRVKWKKKRRGLDGLIHLDASKAPQCGLMGSRPIIPGVVYKGKPGPYSRVLHIIHK